MSNQNVDAVLDRVLAEVDQWAAVRRPAGDISQCQLARCDSDVVDDTGRRKFEARILAGERVTGAEIIRVRATSA